MGFIFISFFKTNGMAINAPEIASSHLIATT